MSTQGRIEIEVMFLLTTSFAYDELERTINALG